MKNPCHILLVEDDPDDIDLLREAFKDSPEVLINVLMQGDKVIPYLTASKNLPNIIVIDLNLPKRHGKEILRDLKVTNSLKHLPVVILTTSSAPAEREFCLANGAARFITKPSTVEGFAQTVNQILSIARGRY